MTAEPVPRPSSHEENAAEDLAEVLTALQDLGRASPDLQAAFARLLAAQPPEAGRRLRLVARARKVSVSMPEDLTAAVQQRVGRGEFSQYVTEAVARQLELDLLGELSALLRAEHGPVSDEALAEARHTWPDV
jgi:Arc/MetJ-type ribon-helix-helix transcriptional regulator